MPDTAIAFLVGLATPFAALGLILVLAGIKAAFDGQSNDDTEQ